MARTKDATEWQALYRAARSEIETLKEERDRLRIELETASSVEDALCQTLLRQKAELGEYRAWIESFSEKGLKAGN
jgi:hypothetical protein